MVALRLHLLHLAGTAVILGLAAPALLAIKDRLAPQLLQIQAVVVAAAVWQQLLLGLQAAAAELAVM